MRVGNGACFVEAMASGRHSREAEKLWFDRFSDCGGKGSDDALLGAGLELSAQFNEVIRREGDADGPAALGDSTVAVFVSLTRQAHVNRLESEFFGVVFNDAP